MGEMMARKGLFTTSDGPAPPPRPPAPLSATAPIGLLRQDLRNMVREIDPDLVDGSPWSDRFPGADPALDELIESIRAHGQLVPAMVRPSATRGRFEIVYGRRRLAAVREVGCPLKAVIHDLDATGALVAQGAENNRRLNPSFIEKAVLASRLTRTEDWSRDVVADVVGTHPTGISRMCSIVDDLGEDLILAIGSCHEIGRRPWQELAVAVTALTGRRRPDLTEVAAIEGDLERFRFVQEWYSQDDSTLAEGVPHGRAADAVAAAEHDPDAGASPRQRQKRFRVLHGNGTAVVMNGSKGTSIKFPATDTSEEMLGWMAANPQEVVGAIHAAWARASGADPES